MRCYRAETYTLMYAGGRDPSSLLDDRHPSSVEQLVEKVGIKFQQIQKYRNRIEPGYGVAVLGYRPGGRGAGQFLERPTTTTSAQDAVER